MRLDIRLIYPQPYAASCPTYRLLQAYLVGDTFVPTEGPDRRLPEGVIFTSLARACERGPTS